MKKAFALIAALILGYGAKPVFAQIKTMLATPLVSIVEITNVIYPLPMPSGGGTITFTYKVTNPGNMPLNDVTVTDDHCAAMSGELGDTNGNHLLDSGETWIYTCAAVLTKTTTHSATVTAYADGLKATDIETTTINVSGQNPTYIPNLPNNGTNPDTLNVTILIWGILGGILIVLIIVYFMVNRKKK